jgi:hypothetical protein
MWPAKGAPVETAAAIKMLCEPVIWERRKGYADFYVTSLQKFN